MQIFINQFVFRRQPAEFNNIKTNQIKEIWYFAIGFLITGWCNETIITRPTFPTTSNMYLSWLQSTLWRIGKRNSINGKKKITKKNLVKSSYYALFSYLGWLMTWKTTSMFMKSLARKTIGDVPIAYAIGGKTVALWSWGKFFWGGNNFLGNLWRERTILGIISAE